MLAPQQTIMRASANLHSEGAAASLQTLIFLDFEHATYLSNYQSLAQISILLERPKALQHAPRIRLINRNINVKLLFFF